MAARALHKSVMLTLGLLLLKVCLAVFLAMLVLDLRLQAVIFGC